MSCLRSPYNKKKSTLVELPAVLCLVHVAIVEALVANGLGSIVIDSTPAMELVLVPLAFIGQVSSLVVQFPIAIHHIVLPAPVIVAPVPIVENALPVALPVDHEPDVLAPVLVHFLHVLALHPHALLVLGLLVRLLRDCQVVGLHVGGIACLGGSQ